jgi:hypothetical protein
MQSQEHMQGVRLHNIAPIRFQNDEELIVPGIRYAMITQG